MNEKVGIIDIEGIEEGMLAADDIKDLNGKVIVRRNMELEGKHLSLFKRAMITQVRVIIPEKVKPRERVHIDDYPNNLDTLKAAGILIVDDSKFSRFKLKKTLEEAGLNVVGTATDGEEGIEQAKKLNPTLITMDIEMPKMDGLTAVGIIRTLLPEVTVVMISSVGEEEKILQALAEGAIDFIVKPIDPVKVKKSIINAIVVEHAY